MSRLKRVNTNRPVVDRLFAVTFTHEPEGGYTVLVPALPGCVSYGETIEDARNNARQAIALHLENLSAHHDAPQTSDQVFTTFVYV